MPGAALPTRRGLHARTQHCTAGGFLSQVLPSHRLRSVRRLRGEHFVTDTPGSVPPMRHGPHARTQHCYAALQHWTKTVGREQAGRQRDWGKCPLALSSRRPTSVGGAQPLSNSNSMSVEVRRPPTLPPRGLAREPVTGSEARKTSPPTRFFGKHLPKNCSVESGEASIRELPLDAQQPGHGRADLGSQWSRSERPLDRPIPVVALSATTGPADPSGRAQSDHWAGRRIPVVALRATTGVAA